MRANRSGHPAIEARGAPSATPGALKEQEMKITGEMLIGASALRGSDATLRAFDPARGAELEPTFGGGGAAEVARACELAEEAFDPFRRASLETRAEFLEAIADNILALGDALIERASAESALPKARIEGERVARARGALDRRDAGFRATGSQAAAASRPAPAEDSGRAGRRVRRE
jgi:NADP-dependent aldehyde dehydrogenase